MLPDLHWWRTYLELGKGRYAHSTEAATLVLSFGNDRGTGTGGTFILPNCPFKMWKGKWNPAVYLFLSN